MRAKYLWLVLVAMAVAACTKPQEDFPPVD